ncbi:VOC family protein [Amycolatopsis sp. WGS_07]|uniref:VOC family protein n=1 Tax=Amycolatopsis sp. WGS_07 TaxID=3076764 RepID=UPI003872EFFA
MPHPFGYMQLATTDIEKSRQFYGELFDWQLTPTGDDDHPYVEIQSGEGPPIGGIMPSAPQAPPMWVPYVQVAGVEPFVAQARKLGGAVLREPAELPDHSWYAVLADPTGAPFALHGPRS